MTPFMDKDFLLKTETAKKLYHEHAAVMPIIDYHCHINPQEIYEDKRYDSITQVWLGGDHYKWRAMRSCGVAEHYITGDATLAEKFQKWAESMPNLIGNPLYHWTHLELQRYFDVYEPLTGDNAMEIYEKCNAILAQPEMSARGIIKKSNVKLLCTTDDPADDLHWHELMAADPTMPAVVLPAFRPDKAMRADKPDFPQYVAKLEGIVVGYVLLKFKDYNWPGVVTRKVMVVDEICVEKSLQNHGIGKAMMEDVHALAKAFRCTDLQLGVYPQNDEAVGFYQKCGFTIRSIDMQRKV